MGLGGLSALTPNYANAILVHLCLIASLIFEI